MSLGSHVASMPTGGDSDLSDEEISGYMNDIIIMMSGFLLSMFISFFLVEFLIGPVLSSFIPAFSGSIINCVWTGSSSVCSGGLGARSLLIVAVGLPLTILWLNNYENRFRTYLVDHGVVPGKNR